MELYKGVNKVGEIDVYVLFGEVGIICQCKSQKLTVASWSGNLVRIKKNFQLAIKEAYDQCRVCFDGLLDSDVIVKDAAGNDVDLQRRECLKLCVSDPPHAVFRYSQASKRPANIMAS